jgi:hypothetical protein
MPEFFLPLVHLEQLLLTLAPSLSETRSHVIWINRNQQIVVLMVIVYPFIIILYLSLCRLTEFKMKYWTLFLRFISVLRARRLPTTFSKNGQMKILFYFFFNLSMSVSVPPVLYSFLCLSHSLITFLVFFSFRRNVGLKQMAHMFATLT